MGTDTAISTPIPTGTWTLDPVHSSAGFAVKHMVVATFRGRFERFDATLVADDGGARLEGTVDVDSIVVNDESLAGHLKSPEFFDVERHPVLSFTSRDLRRSGDELAIDGELTIKGRTRPIEARGTITGPVVGLGDAERVGLTLEAVIDRREYGLDWNAPLPKGGNAIGEEVTLTVHLEMRRKEE